MKLWKALVIIPYVLIFGVIYISISTMASGNLGGLFIGGTFWAVGIVIGLIYTAILGISLVTRWFILKRRKVKEEASHDKSIVEARTALPLDGGVKCRQLERVEDGGNRSVPRGETGYDRKDEK